MDAVEILWQDAKETTFLARCDFDLAIAQCEVHSVNGIGAVLIKGPEIHCAGITKGWLTRKVIRTHLTRLIGQYGYATAMIHINDIQGQALAERLGFVRTGSNGLDCFYKIERATHG